MIDNFIKMAPPLRITTREAVLLGLAAVAAVTLLLAVVVGLFV